MRRDVTAHLDLSVVEPAVLALQIAVAGGAQEELRLTLDGRPIDPEELPSGQERRTHLLEAAPGWLVVEYSARVEGRRAIPPTGPLDRLEALRPSRYCPSDRMLGVASREFGEIDGAAPRIAAVTRWVRGHLAYVSGSSRGTDDALDTYLQGAGVCRDFAHLVITLLRALDVPARLAAVYAPGLSPMDFHAVVEAWDGEGWWVVDATGLAPRESMVRISTGRDAADTAFLTTLHGQVDLVSMQVTAVVDVLPLDDPDARATLG